MRIAQFVTNGFWARYALPFAPGAPCFGAPLHLFEPL